MDFMGYVRKGWAIVKLDRDAAGEVASDPESFGPAVLFYAISGLATGISGTIVSAGAGVFLLFSAPVFAVIGSFIGAGILHLIARVLGGTGEFRGYYSALGIGSVIRWALVVPVIGFIAALWYLPVVVIVTERVHRITTARAIMVVLIPAIIGLLLLLALVAAVGMAVFMSVMQGGMQGM